MKNKLLYFILALLPIGAFAQKVSVKQSMPTVLVPELYDTQEFREQLVEEAIKNTPDLKAASRETLNQKYNIAISKSKWLDYIQVTGNLNEFTLNPGEYNEQATFYPRYNFALSFSLGSLFSNAYGTKIAKNNYIIAQENERSTTLELRTKVLSKFEEYVEVREALKLQSAVYNDEETLHTLNERKFKSNEISLEEFNGSSNSLVDVKTKALELQKQYAITKYELEGLIGAIIIDSKF